MRVLITGANGFIGNKMASLFKDKGFNVSGVDVMVSSINFDTHIVDLTDLEKVKYLLLDIRPDIIVHCAGNASVPVSVKDPLADLDRNVVVTETLLVAMKELNYHPRLVFLSSAGVYGNQPSNPFKEDYQPMPLSPYALHKYFCEQMCLYYVRNYDYDIKIARIFSAYGPGLRKQIFWDMSEKLTNLRKLELGGTGEESRDFIYIDDLIEALYGIAVSKYDDVIINVATGTDTCIKDIATIFVNTFGDGLDKSAIHFTNISREGDPKNMRADVSKLNSLGFTPKVSINEGIARYIEWYKREKK